MEDQLSRLREYEEAIYQFKPHLEELERINQQIQESFVFENRYTQYTMETLRVGWEQLVTSGIYSFFDRKLYYQRSFELEYLANYSKGEGGSSKMSLISYKNSRICIKLPQFFMFLLSCGYNSRSWNVQIIFRLRTLT